MKIELTENESMWILDKVAQECARGKAAIDALSDDKDPSIQRGVEMAKEIVNALAKLGMKIADAMKAEIDAAEKEKAGDPE